jgi:SPP1 family predicted phage head-tail adaptor
MTKLGGPTPFNTFRDRIDFYEVTETVDTYGGVTTTETMIGSAWGAVEKVTGTRSFLQGEVIIAGGLGTKGLYAITTWWRKDITITPKCIIKHEEHVYDVLQVENVQSKNVFMWIYCKEIGADT